MVRRMLHSYGEEKAERALAAFEADVAAFDAVQASPSKRVLAADELRTLRRRLETAALEVGLEHEATSDMNRTYERYLEAARALDLAIAGEEQADARQDKENSLALLVATLEAFAPQLSAEALAAAQSDAWLGRLSAAVEMLEAKLAAETPAATQAAAGASGLMRSLSQINAILDRMTRDALADRESAEAARRLIDFETSELQSDPNIATALGRVAAGKSEETTDLHERLEELLRGTSPDMGNRPGQDI